MTQKHMFELQCRQGKLRVIATRFEVENGDLVFHDNNTALAAFARGEWETVSMIGEAE